MITPHSHTLPRRLTWSRIALAALLSLPVIANAWDPMGHMLVGEIAWQKAKPETRDKVAQLVATLDNTYNEKQPYNFVTAGCWMDDMRSQRPYPWAPLHYVTVPYTPTGSAFTEPPPPHVLSAMDECLATLKKADATDAEKTQAVGMLIHCVGDVHQPLHTTDWNDRGGNGYMIMGVPFSDLMKRQLANLHTYWDKAFRFDGKDGQIVELVVAPEVAARSAPGEGVIAVEAQKIIAEFPPEKLPQVGESDHRAWARESHLIGCLAAYPTGPHPGDTAVVKLEPDFVQKVRPIACERVALAGYRLARMLDELFAK